MALVYKDPVLIIGAPRSGTKMLRELLKLHPKIIGPVYEKERVWSYGNMNRFGKSIHENQITPVIKDYIRKHFDKIAKKNPGKLIVDKNVPNSLRIEFVREVFPKAPVIYIVRDGRDAVSSIRNMWESPLELKYIFQNRAFPLEEIPFFVKLQIQWYFQILTGKQKHAKWWGPRFDDMDELVENYPLIEVCCIQYKRCVEAVEKSMINLKISNFIQVKYENIILNPVEEINCIYQLLELDSYEELNDKLNSYITPGCSGNWEQRLSERELSSVLKHIEKILKFYGYINN